MNKATLISTISMFLAFLALATANAGDEDIKDQLTYLGVVDGRGFFADTLQTRNWSEANSVCRSSNLNLTSLNTLAETEFLVGSLKIFSNESYQFWTSARESRSHSIFAWDDTDAQPENGIVNEWDLSSLDNEPYTYCASFSVVNDKSKLTGRFCSETAGVLCST